MEAGRKEAGQDELKQLQSEVDELRGLLAKLDMERETLMKQARILEDRQVTNWKWIQDATKFSGYLDLKSYHQRNNIQISFYYDFRRVGKQVQSKILYISFSPHVEIGIATNLFDDG